jgi:hypothetical protein
MLVKHHEPVLGKGIAHVNTVKDVLKAGKVAVGTGAGPDAGTAALRA